MDKESERELSVERLLYQSSSYSHCVKLDFKMKGFFVNIAEHLNPVVKASALEALEKLFEHVQLSGSVAEGAMFARNLNPNLPKKYLEGEFDLMLPFAKILRNKSREVIVDLVYAKGFVWIKYEAGCFESDSSKELCEILFKYDDGNTYLNAEAVRNTEASYTEFSPESQFFVKNQIHGPSLNTEAMAGNLVFPSKASLNDAIKILHDCALFIQAASEDLKKLHEHVLLKLEELEKITQSNCELISITDIKELASLILPSNRERKNVLLQVHWILSAFIKKTLSTILAIERILRKPDITENLVAHRVWYMQLFSNPKALFDNIDSYFKYLLNILPAEVLQKYKKEPVDGLSYFFQKCFSFQQDIVEDLFRILDNCKKELLRRCQFLDVSIRDPNGPAEKVNKILEMCISIDKVPAITVKDWPHIASEWVNRGRLWPSLSLVKEIVMKGCHVVPKPCYGAKSNGLLDWRWSFSLAEIILATTRTKEMDLSYLVLKSIFYRYLKPVEYNDETLTSYLIKTVMLWQCEENVENWWSERTIVSCISVLLDKLKESFHNRHLPHYLIRDINLFDNVADGIVLYGQAILESICAEPITCIEEVVENLIGKQSEKGCKTTLETDSECKLNIPLLREEFIKMMQNDSNVPAFFRPAMNTFQTLFEEVMPQLFPGVTGVQRENVSQESEINEMIDDIMEIAKRAISDTFDISLD